MYNHHEDAVRIAYYFVWDTEADEYDFVWLCEECAAERDGDPRIAGDLSPGERKRCMDCDCPNEALLGAKLLGILDETTGELDWSETPVKIGVYDDHDAYARSDELQYAFLCDGCAEWRDPNVTHLSTVEAGETIRCDDCGSPNRDYDDEEEGELES
jgi:hypothetical protein